MTTPDELEYRPIDPADIPAYAEATARAFVEEQVRSGRTAEVREDDVQATIAQYFPNGQPHPDHAIFDIRHHNQHVGWLWLGCTQGVAFVYEVTLDETWRGRGWGRAAMREAERWARKQGCRKLSLHVFGHNSRAIALYQSLGYEVTGMTMNLDLVPVGTASA